MSAFISPTHGTLSISEMIDEISNFVKKDSTSFYSLVIGTDSKAKVNNGTSEIDFVSAIVVVRKGRGGIYFWKKAKVNKKPILREKIYTETLMSLEIAEDLVPDLRHAISPAKHDLEIHIDVGSLGPTREMIKEVVGMVTGSGYIAKTKPEAYAAYSVADKHT